MPRLLHIDSSAAAASSVSRGLTRLFADTWRSRGPEFTVTERDLHRDQVPHLLDAELHYAPRLRIRDVPGGATAQFAAAESLQGELIEEIAAADVVVIGAPMYNWSLPSALKAWIDHVHVLGTTVPFDTPDRPFAGKPVVVLSSRGNTYAPGTAGAGTDFATPALQQVLGVSMGMAVTVVPVELTLAPRIPALAAFVDQAEASRTAARAAVTDLARSLGS
ncbi:FMN-dependent NADH-azoreductase [Rhodococcus gannanensis]|uniref:FMN dependent NADH:quinone oxidoreductase n=1 Tax=Rhodococcus gannanensis TaxID=1960308 RepID=A0ABW4NZD5_9NOCA